MSANVPPSDGTGGAGSKLATPRVLIGALITVAALWFIFANTTEVRIRLWVTYVSAPLWLVLLLTFVAGGLVGMLFARARRKRKLQRI